MPATRKTRWNIVALAVTAGIVSAMQVGKVPPAIASIRAELLLGLVTAGWVISLFNATSAALGAAAGVIGDHLGHRRTVLGGLLCLSAGSLAGGLAADGSMLLLARLVEGIGFVAVSIAAPSLIAAVTAPADLRLAIGAYWGTYMPTGMALMMVATPLLLNTLGWRGLWFANAALLAIVCLAFAVATRGIGAPPSQKRTLASVRFVLLRPGPWLLAACFAAYTVQFFAVMSWLPTFLMETLGYGITQAALIVAFIVTCNALGNLLGGWLLHLGIPRWRLLAFASGALGILALGIFADGTTEWGKILMAVAFSTLGGFIPSSVLAGVPEHAPSPTQMGATNGIIIQGSNTGSLLGPPAFAALVAALGGWSASSWLLFASGCIGIALALVLRGIETDLSP